MIKTIKSEGKFIDRPLEGVRTFIIETMKT